jgi:hypothetical protein
MADDANLRDTPIPTSGRPLALKPGPIFHLQRADAAKHELGAFRAWAGYKDFGCDAATDGLVLFQHVLSFAPSEVSGRTGIHSHLAHVHIVIPSSGEGVFSYDGVVTPALPGTVINQHGGTVHDQFSYSYAAASPEENRLTPLRVDPTPPSAPPESFSFLELFVPSVIADVEIVPPGSVTPQDQATAWDHPYHAPSGRFSVQPADDPGAAWRPVEGHLEWQARDAGTWDASGRLVATHILRAAVAAPTEAAPVSLAIPGEAGGLEVFLVVAGAVSVRRPNGAPLRLEAGDCLTCTAGLAGAPSEPSPDVRLLRFFVSSRAEGLWQRSPAEIEQLEAMGPKIIRRREVRPEGDPRPVNCLRQDDAA